jgi:hypothetical protein
MRQRFNISFPANSQPVASNNAAMQVRIASAWKLIALARDPSRSFDDADSGFRVRHSSWAHPVLDELVNATGQHRGALVGHGLVARPFLKRRTLRDRGPIGDVPFRVGKASAGFNGGSVSGV